MVQYQMALLGMCVTPCKDLKAIRELMHGQCVSSTLAVHCGSLKRSRNSSLHKNIRVSHHWMTPGKLGNFLAQRIAPRVCFGQCCLLMTFFAGIISDRSCSAPCVPLDEAHSEDSDDDVVVPPLLQVKKSYTHF